MEAYMKMVFCTLAICLSVLAATLSLSNLVRSEGKKTRSLVSRMLADPAAAPSDHKDAVLQKMDLISARLTAIERSLSSPEEMTPDTVATSASSDSSHAEMYTLTRRLEGLNNSLAKLQGVPAHLAALTTYLDRSFAHIEKVVTPSASPDDLLKAIGKIDERTSAIDGHFMPLCTFLGLPYDLSNSDALAAYPSVDKRLNALALQIEAVRKDVADVRHLFPPQVMEPTKYSR